MLKIKLAACYAVYIMAIAALFSKRLIGITRYRNGAVSGVLIFAMLTFWVLYLTIYLIKKDSIERLKALAGDARKITPEETLLEYSQYANMAARTLDWRIKDEIARMGELAALMDSKLKTIDSLLLESFSRNDLAYVSYKDNIGSVLEEYLSNFKSVKTRADAFDVNWHADNGAALVIESEMQKYLKKNEEILAQVDSFMIELIRLADKDNENSRSAMQTLVEDTRNYSVIKKGR